MLPSNRYLDNHITYKALKVPQIILLSSCWTKIREFCNMPYYLLLDRVHPARLQKKVSCKLQKKNWMVGRDCGKQLKGNNLDNRSKMHLKIAK